jgi:hypothetical protein
MKEGHASRALATARTRSIDPDYVQSVGSGLSDGCRGIGDYEVSDPIREYRELSALIA